MGPQELKELPKENPDELEEGDISISDDEVVGDDEPEPPADPDPELVNVEVEDDEDVQEDEDDEQGDDDPVEDEEDDADDDDDETSEGGKDDDSDDEDDEEEKAALQDSDIDVDDDDDDDEEEDDDAEGTHDVKEGGTGDKKPIFGKGKGISGISHTGHEYKGDIEDLLRAAAQADEGETSARNDQGDGFENLIRAAVVRESREAPQIIIKTTEEIECEVVDILDEGEEIDNLKGDLGNLRNESTEKGSHNIADEIDDPPVKRMKNA